MLFIGGNKMNITIGKKLKGIMCETALQEIQIILGKRISFVVQIRKPITPTEALQIIASKQEPIFVKKRTKMKMVTDKKNTIMNHTKFKPLKLKVRKTQFGDVFEELPKYENKRTNKRTKRTKRKAK